MNREELRYRNGFIFSMNYTGNLPVPSGWKLKAIHGGYLKYHPETNVSIRNMGNGAILLIGECFHPDELIFNIDEVVDRLSSASSNREDLLDLLDNLAGRFALLVFSEGEWEVFHDAIGSRSVFYHKEERLVASHIGLISSALDLKYADYFIPFLTSKNYQEKDVKYLPGLWTPYENIRQLSPNTSLSTKNMKVSRYWPRAELKAGIEVEGAADTLTKHMKGLCRYLKQSEKKVLLGLTGGTDSRGLYSGLYSLRPTLFTWIRSKDGAAQSSKDSNAAQAIASLYEHEVHLWPLKTPKLNDVMDDISLVFREATSGYRGSSSAWLRPMHDLNSQYANSIFVRGFGGEILRGFYQESSNRIKANTPAGLSAAYDINAGSDLTREAFREFIDDTQFSSERFLGRDVNDMFYWEHRMGTWGSIAMSEADISVRGLTGYNSRRLFDTFLGMDYEARKSRVATAKSVIQLAPEIQSVPIV